MKKPNNANAPVTQGGETALKTEKRSQAKKKLAWMRNNYGLYIMLFPGVCVAFRVFDSSYVRALYGVYRIYAVYSHLEIQKRRVA